MPSNCHACATVAGRQRAPEAPVSTVVKRRIVALGYVDRFSPRGAPCRCPAAAAALQHARLVFLVPDGGRAAYAARRARPRAHGWAAACGRVAAHQPQRCAQLRAFRQRRQVPVRHHRQRAGHCAGSRTSRAYSATPSSSSAEPVLPPAGARAPCRRRPRQSCGTSGLAASSSQRRNSGRLERAAQQRAVQADDGRRSGMAFGRASALGDGARR